MQADCNGINKTEETEIIPLRYLVNDKYSSVALSVNVTAVINLSADPILPTMVKAGETVRWNLILKDKNDNDLIDDISSKRDWMEIGKSHLLHRISSIYQSIVPQPASTPFILSDCTKARKLVSQFRP